MENLQNEIRWLLQEKYGNKPSEKFNKDVDRLKKGEPLDYVIGFTEFLGCKILVDKNVLIPRFETEFWVQEAIEEISNSKFQASRILDMFAGSGCIGLAILKNIKNAQVVFADSEKNALHMLQKSCRINKIPKTRYKIMQSDVFSNVKGAFDYIFANPPYIPLKRKGKIQPSVLKYEPKEALFGGSDGLFFIRKFLAEAKNFLNPGGKIYMEFDPPQKKQITALLKKYKSWQFHKDQYGKWRWVQIG